MAMLSHVSIAFLDAPHAVEEEQGQDHIYVVFSLPALGSPAHRSRTLQPGPWGPDVQASGLMGLVGHTYLQKGAAQLLPYYDQSINVGWVPSPPAAPVFKETARRNPRLSCKSGCVLLCRAWHGCEVRELCGLVTECPGSCEAGMKRAQSGVRSLRQYGKREL